MVALSPSSSTLHSPTPPHTTTTTTTTTQPQTHLKKASWFNAQFNLTNSAIGAGLLCLPQASAKSGLLVSIILAVIIGTLSGASHYFLADAGAKTGAKGYRELVKKTFGRSGEFLYVALVTVMLLGPCTAYFKLTSAFTLKVIAEVYHVATPEEIGQWWANKWVISALFGVLIKFPLSCITPISRLAKASLLALVIILYGIVLIIYGSVNQIAKEGVAGKTLGIASLSLMSTISVIGFSYANHFIYLELTSEMERPTRARHVSLITASSGACILIYGFIGLIGYMAFGHMTDDVILDNIPGVPTQICYIAFAVMLCLSYPLVLSPIRDNLTWFATQFGLKQPATRIVESNQVWIVRSYNRVFSQGWVFYTFTVCIMLVTYILANSFSKVGDILDVFFSISGGVLVFIVPAAAWWVIGFRAETNSLGASIQKQSDMSKWQQWCLKEVADADIVTIEDTDLDYEVARDTFPHSRAGILKFAAVVNIAFGMFIFTVGTAFAIRNVIVAKK